MFSVSRPDNLLPSNLDALPHNLILCAGGEEREGGGERVTSRNETPKTAGHDADNWFTMEVQAAEERLVFATHIPEEKECRENNVTVYALHFFNTRHDAVSPVKAAWYTGEGVRE